MRKLALFFSSMKFPDGYVELASLSLISGDREYVECVKDSIDPCFEKLGS